MSILYGSFLEDVSDSSAVSFTSHDKVWSDYPVVSNHCLWYVFSKFVGVFFCDDNISIIIFITIMTIM